MGYKLAGYNVIGGVEIDPEMMKIYRENHRPEHSYLMGVQDFKNIPDKDLPKGLFNIDILDGSPPCSSFSMAGSREKEWGEKKKFREGQADQVLDNLFFDFIDVAKKLKPKVVVAENVKGLIIGKAKGYVKQIYKAFDMAGYDVQLFLLNSAFMGVPQRRERTFFIARRKDLNLPNISLNFNEPLISVKDAFMGASLEGSKKLSELQNKYWGKTKQGNSFSEAAKGSWFTWVRLSESIPSNTVHSGPAQTHPTEPRFLSNQEHFRLQSFPDDYNLLSVDARYICGMSVPPFMMQRIANQIHQQWLIKFSKPILRKKSK